MLRLIVIGLAMVISLTPVLVAGSDTESEPFMIYVDPVTGKYTRQKPNHNAASTNTQTTDSASNLPQSDPQPTQLAPAFLFAGGLLLVCHLLSKMYVRFRK